MYVGIWIATDTNLDKIATARILFLSLRANIRTEDTCTNTVPVSYTPRGPGPGRWARADAGPLWDRVAAVPRQQRQAWQAQLRGRGGSCREALTIFYCGTGVVPRATSVLTARVVRVVTCDGVNGRSARAKARQ